MTLDFVILVAVVLFALFGALSGFARQVGQAVALAVAFLTAAPSGRLLGPLLAERLTSSLTVGLVLATVVAFLLLYLLVRSLVTWLFRRVLAGKNPESRGLDRLLGGLLGGGKAGAMAWLGLCAVVFLEHNLVVAGKTYSLTPKDSILVPLARRYNLIEQLQFSGLQDLGKALSVASAPASASRLKNDPDYAALMKDQRFRGLLSQEGLGQLLKANDLRALLKDRQVLELIRDERALRHLEKLGERQQ